MFVGLCCSNPFPVCGGKTGMPLLSSCVPNIKCVFKGLLAGNFLARCGFIVVAEPFIDAFRTRLLLVSDEGDLSAML